MSRKSRAKRKRSRQVKHDTQASRSAYDKQYEDKGREAPTGYHATPTYRALGQGGSRIATHCLTLGVIPESEIAELLRDTAKEAKYQLSQHRPHGAGTMLRILVAAAKLELDTVVASNKPGGPLAAQIPHGDGNQPEGAFLEQASQDDLKETAEILDQLGLLTTSAPAETKTPPQR